MSKLKVKFKLFYRLKKAIQNKAKLKKLGKKIK